MILYHGTDYEAGKNIAENGFVHYNNIWLVSDIKQVYFIDANSEESERFAYDAAVTAAAYKGSKSSDICILKLDIDEQEMLPDCSVEDMTDCYQIESTKLNDLLKNKNAKLEINIIKNAYNPYLRPVYLTHIASRKDCPIAFEDELFEQAVKYMDKYLNSTGYDLYLDNENFDLNTAEKIEITFTNKKS